MMTDVVCGIGTAVTTFGVTSSATGDITVSLIASVISAVIFALINIGTKVITSILEKKGLISHSDKKKVDETADDLADDGKLNNSNEKEDI